MTKRQKNYHSALLKKAHIVKGNYFPDDESRRAYLFCNYGVYSFKDMRIDGLLDIIKLCQPNKGQPHAAVPTNDRHAQLDWASLHEWTLLEIDAYKQINKPTPSLPCNATPQEGNITIAQIDTIYKIWSKYSRLKTRLSLLKLASKVCGLKVKPAFLCYLSVKQGQQLVNAVLKIKHFRENAKR